MSGTALSGPRPDSFRLRARQLLKESKALDMAARVIRAEETEDRTTKDGDIVQVRPAIRDRLSATELLLKTGGVLVSKVEDVTPVSPTERATAELLAAIPRILGVLGVNQQERVKLLEAIEVDAEVVG